MSITASTASMSSTATPTPTSPADVPPTTGQFDWWLFLVTTLLLGLGLLMTLSSSSMTADQQYGDALHYFTRQVMGLGMGIAQAIVVLMLPWRTFRRSGLVMYGLVLLGLVLVFSPLGNEAKGASRWFSLGPINIQPSEYAKIALIMTLGSYLAANEGRLGDVVGTLVPAIALPVPFMALILLEPDFGTTVVLTAITGTLLLLAGLRWRWVGALASVAVAGGALLVVLEPYRMRRLTGFLDPFADPDGAGYQVVQGWIALASGGWTGQGLASGVAQRGFLPEAHTDFISAVVAEELGGIGFAGMIALYVVFLWRGVRIANHAPDLFGTLVAMGITALLGMQAVINLGVVVGWLPAKGLVLPFMSYGASAITVHVLCVGILLRIGLQGALPPPAPKPKES